MLRFDRHSSRQITPVSRKLRLKLWLLLGMLGLVGLMMRHLQQPETVENLGRLFSLQEPSADSSPRKNEVSKQPFDFRQETSDESSTIVMGDDKDESASLNLTAKDNELGKTDRFNKSNIETPENSLPTRLAGVQDNSVFLKSETAAWLATLSEVKHTPTSEIEEATNGKVAYAQLVQQPQVYRGRVVTIHGTALREELLRPTDNDLGIDTYHRLILAPEGGGEYPFFVYVLALPDEFPRGDQIRQRVVIHGYFFKNNSYATDEGMSVAPVVVAKEVQWQPDDTAGTSQTQVNTEFLPWWAIAAVAVFAILLVTVLHLNTRRKRTSLKTHDKSAIADLQRLVKEEGTD